MFFRLIGKHTATEIIVTVPPDLAAGEDLLQVRSRSNEKHIQIGDLALTMPG